jgi:DNA-directed RNA polymerase specialized sigma24 family protein
MQQGRYPELADRDGLWRLLLKVMTRRALDRARRERSQRRGGGGEQTYSQTSEIAGADLSVLSADETSPELAVEMDENFRGLLERLPDDDLRALALMKLDGHGNDAVAQSLGCSVRTVERRLRLIRDLWRSEESR